MDVLKKHFVQEGRLEETVALRIQIYTPLTVLLVTALPVQCCVVPNLAADGTIKQFDMTKIKTMDTIAEIYTKRKSLQQQ